MNEILNIKEFARVAGVSTATISRVYANDPKVRPATRERILALGKTCGFRINLAARSTVAGKTRNIGVLLHRLTTSYFAEIAVGIQEVLFPAGYMPIISNLPRATELTGLRAMIDRRVDGLIAACSQIPFPEEDRCEILRFRLPGVAVDTTDPGLGWDCVLSDEEAIGNLAVERLRRGTTRRWGMFGMHAQNRRWAVFLAGARALGVEPVTAVAEDEAGVAAAAARFLDRLGRGGAVFCRNDIDALTLCRAAAARNWRIPEDVQVLGVGDLNFASAMSPGLTTIRQSGMAVGRAAAARLLKRLGGDDSPPETIKIGVDLIERNSLKEAER